MTGIVYRYPEVFGTIMFFEDPYPEVPRDTEYLEESIPWIAKCSAHASSTLGIKPGIVVGVYPM